MNAKKIILITSAIFYIIILCLSLSAKKIHIASLPKVKVTQLDHARFKVSDSADIGTIQSDETDEIHIGDIQEARADNDNISNDDTLDYIPSDSFGLAIPKSICDNKKVYVLSIQIINGEERTIAKEVTDLELGNSNEDYYEVINGIHIFDQVIIEGQEKIQDGCEVYVEE